VNVPLIDDRATLVDREPTTARSCSEHHVGEAVHLVWIGTAGEQDQLVAADRGKALHLVLQR
jgi:hypothetical protein